MRKVILYMHVSLDGYVARVDGTLDWIFPDYDDALQEWTVNLLNQVDTHVLGRPTYLEQAQFWPTATDEMAPLVNEATKIVFASEPIELTWQNSRLAQADLATELSLLKQQAGKDIYISGGARLAQSASRLGVVDEYQLVVHPVALGTGLPLFAAPIDLKLLSSKEFATGAVAMALRPA